MDAPPDLKQLKLSDYDMSETAGFMPPFEPCRKLPDYFKPWEDIIDDLPQLIDNKQIRERVKQLPELEISETTLGRWYSKTEPGPVWWRAYVVATFIAQAYIWMDKADKDIELFVPRCIAVPWWNVAKEVRVPPVVTYSSACLYNWGLHDPHKPPDGENMYSLITYTGLPDESWFYIISLLVEIEAVPGINAVVEAYNAIARNDDATSETVQRCLKAIKVSVDNMTKKALMRMAERGEKQLKCRPEKFYGDIRRFQRGSTDDKLTPDGITYEGVPSNPQKVCGASAAQSSTLPVFDIFLGVNHAPTPLEPGASEAEKKEYEVAKASHDFLLEQRDHMPTQHREFLQALEKQLKQPRDYIARSGNPEMVRCFNDIIDAITVFRSEHFILVSRYIIAQIPSSGEADTKSNEENATGTGGTALASFLKKVRADAENAKLPVP